MKAIITLKADKETKEQAQKIASDLGLTLSAIVNASLKQFIRTKEVYFSAMPKMTVELEKLIANVEKDIKSGENISKIYDSADEALEYLNS
jgi:addiction module RelB/DinJ family antitoxin